MQEGDSRFPSLVFSSLPLSPFFLHYFLGLMHLCFNMHLALPTVTLMSSQVSNSQSHFCYFVGKITILVVGYLSLDLVHVILTQCHAHLLCIIPICIVPILSDMYLVSLCLVLFFIDKKFE